MTVELFYLFLTALLLSFLWLPYIAGIVAYSGLPDREYYRRPRDLSRFPEWVQRANRAHLNLVEQFGPYAAFVLIGAVMDVSSQATQVAAALFFWARVAHAWIMIAGWTRFYARTLAFLVANFALLVYAVELWRLATLG